jgi:hypothetical protein
MSVLTSYVVCAPSLSILVLTVTFLDYGGLYGRAASYYGEENARGHTRG